MEMQSQVFDAQFIRSCPLCGRVYTQEYSYTRHVKYCDRAQTRRKGRPRSCLACSAAKVKCSFATPCSRCQMRGEECIYTGPKSGSSVNTVQGPQSRQEQHGLQNLDSNIDDQSRPWLDNTTSLFTNLLEEQDALTLEYGVEQITPFNDSSLERTSPGRIKDKFLPTFPQGSHSQQQINISTASRRSMAYVFDEAVARQMAIQDLTRLSYQSPTLKQAARLIVHALSAFPQMMLRRQTFPPFIHPYWHKAYLPEKLASCMSISQLFAARTPETRPFLWRTIDAEEQRFRDEFESLSALEIQPAVQSMMIYMIMAIIDRDDDTPKRGARMLETSRLLCSRFRNLLGAYSSTETAEPSVTWEEWVFAESRRRVTCLWFTISCVLSVDTEIPCETCGQLGDMPLLSSKTLWEARTFQDWQIEKAFYDASSPIETLGELIKVKEDPTGPLHKQKLHVWEAGADKMATMVTIATEFV